MLNQLSQSVKRARSAFPTYQRKPRAPPTLPPPLLGFVIAFAGFPLLHSFNVIPTNLVALGSDFS
jgi:hypothetical protein